MNLFYLDYDHNINAFYHCDKHVVKMILESCQLLSTAHHLCGSVGPYKLTHKNHPTAIWVRESVENYMWTYEYFVSLMHEYTFRYGKKHKCGMYQDRLSIVPEIPNRGLTNFALAMPDYCKLDDPVLSYRNYYNKEKRHLFRWTKRETPYWITQNENVCL